MKASCLIFLLFFSSTLVAQDAISPISATVELYQGKPTIMLDKEPQNPMFYALTDVPGGRWSWEELPANTIRSFCDHGLNWFR